MAWKDLSIAQRSQLMNLMRRNGVNSLSEMRRLYDLSTVNLPIEESTFNINPAAPVYANGGNKFYDGSVKKSRIARGLKRIKEEADAAKGSFEEFVRNKVQPIRDAALKTSRERTEPVPVGPVRVTDDELNYEINKLYFDAVQAYRNADAYANAESYVDAVRNYGATPSMAAFESDDRSQREHARLMEKRLEAQFEQEAAEYESGKKTMMKEGSTCAQTGTNNYGQQYTQSGNQTIFAYPELAGLFQIPFSEAQPGDFIQALREDGTPYHGMILDSKNEKGVNLYNYSDGGVGEGHYEKAATYYPSQDNERYRNAYRFAGTPADSTRWRQEWLASQQKFGGKKFETGGNKKKKEGPYARKYREEQEAKAKREREHPTLKNVFRHDIASESGDEYYDVINARYTQAMDALKRKGFSYEDSLRLAPLIVTQNIVEGGWRVARPDDNNFGGLRDNGRFLKFSSPEEYYDNYLDLLDRKWGPSRGTVNNWRNAQNLDDWSRILNREDLRLWSKERYNDYNKEHRDNPVYLYAPEWENGGRSYRSHLADVEARVNTYLDMVLKENPYTMEMYNATTEPVAHQNDNFNLSMNQFQDLLESNRENFAKGGHKIHIKKENRGKFTALKKRTGKSASWFKAHGTPAQKKMAIFALNSRHWGKKKLHGGIKF